MAILRIFRKRAPGTCAACGKTTAVFRCPACHRELCEACVQAAAESLVAEEGGSHLRIDFVSGGEENREKPGRGESGLQTRKEEMRRIIREGGGICLGCSIRKKKAVALKKIRHSPKTRD